MQFLGNEFSIPDSVMGLTLLAIGMSVPEMVSSIAVARQGLQLKKKKIKLKFGFERERDNLIRFLFL